MPRDIKRILISQPKPAQSRSPYYQMSEDYGVELTFKPFFSIQPISARSFRDEKIDVLDFTGVVLTSRTLADHFFGVVKELRIDLPDDFKYFCSSDTVGSYLQKHTTVRKRKLFIPEKIGPEADILTIILKHSKDRFLIPYTEGHKEELFNTLAEKNITFTKCIMSQTIYTDLSREEIDGYDMMVFFSPNGVESLRHNYPDYKQGDQVIACLGEGTQKSLEAYGLRVDAHAPSKEFSSITAAIEAYLRKNKAKVTAGAR